MLDVSGLVVLDATGTSSMSLSLPANLLAGSLFLQGFALAGFAASQGLQMRIPY